jgi:transposase
MKTIRNGMPLRLRCPQRHQQVMVARSIDQLLPPEHSARIVWEVAGRLDLSAFYRKIQAVPGSAGRDHTDPRLLLALWLQAHIDGVGSARSLETLCQEHDAYRWLCGGVSVNHHTLSDFRVGHEQALDDLFTQQLATLSDKGLIQVQCISQDGVRVRASAGADSFHREQRLMELLEKSRAHVVELKKQMEDPAVAAQVAAAQQAARQRAAEDRQKRLEEAMAQLPELQKAQEQLARRSSGKQKEKMRAKRPPRVSTTDPEARVMKTADGGFRPAYNVQIATDVDSRVIVGVDVSNRGVDNAGQGPEMRRQVEERVGRKAPTHLMDGGYLKEEHIEQAMAEGVTVLMPPKPPRGSKRKSGCEPCRDDSPAIAEWRKRMGSPEGQALYRKRAATSETVNADLRCFRGLCQFVVRGLKKVRCVALWSAMAYNLVHWGSLMVG